jgi:hypothetical protein
MHTRGVGGKPDVLFGLVGGYAFYQTYCADGNKIVLVDCLRIVFFSLYAPRGAVPLNQIFLASASPAIVRSMYIFSSSEKAAEGKSLWALRDAGSYKRCAKGAKSAAESISQPPFKSLSNERTSNIKASAIYSITAHLSKSKLFCRHAGQLCVNDGFAAFEKRFVLPG